MSGEEEVRARLLAALEGVDGWLWPAEAWALHELARRADTPDPTVVEIGSWLGRSTIALGLGIARRGAGRVVAIDPHEGSDVRFEEFLANLRSAGVDRWVEPVRMTSREARERVEVDSIDVLFVDGSHEYDDVVGDIADWVPKLRRGATVAFNDPFLPGVQRAIAKRILRPGSPFGRPRLVTNTVFFRYGRPMGSLMRVRLGAVLAFGRAWLPFHVRVFASKWIPLWIKVSQAVMARAVMRMLFPVEALATREIPRTGE